MMNDLKPLSWSALLQLFGLPTVLNFIACRVAIPLLDSQKIFPAEITYFLSVGLLVLVPIFFGAIYLSARDTKSSKISDILSRMRIRKLSPMDWLWTIGGFVVLSLASFLIAKIILPLFGINATPFFFQNMPLKDQNFWILYVWPIFFFFNIFGEEFMWRGYIQPRQEILNGRLTWLFHGLLWSIFHLPMGVDLVYSALPTFFILPAVVQVRKNTTIAIVIHFIFGAFGFLSLAFGMVH
jgi:membrane protease YdiL (CAAX protease family)